MLIADTSAWVEWLRQTGSTTHIAFRQAVGDDLVLLPEPVKAELIFAARSRDEVTSLRRLLETVDLELVHPRADFESAAELPEAAGSFVLI